MSHLGLRSETQWILPTLSVYSERAHRSPWWPQAISFPRLSPQLKSSTVNEHLMLHALNDEPHECRHWGRPRDRLRYCHWYSILIQLSSAFCTSNTLTPTRVIGYVTWQPELAKQREEREGHFQNQHPRVNRDNEISNAILNDLREAGQQIRDERPVGFAWKLRQQLFQRSKKVEGESAGSPDQKGS